MQTISIMVSSTDWKIGMTTHISRRETGQPTCSIWMLEAAIGRWITVSKTVHLITMMVVI